MKNSLIEVGAANPSFQKPRIRLPDLTLFLISQLALCLYKAPYLKCSEPFANSFGST